MEIKNLLEQSAMKDNAKRKAALDEILDITEERVEWMEEHYEDLRERLGSDNSFQRSIGMMILCNLAKSDMKNHMGESLPEILRLLNDEKFITRRQTVQNIWKIAVAREDLRQEIIQNLLKRFHECRSEDHYNLIRQDLISALYNIHQAAPADCPLSLLEDMAEIEEDKALRNKYRKVFE